MENGDAIALAVLCFVCGLRAVALLSYAVKKAET
jgi:hypothetical protein